MNDNATTPGPQSRRDLLKKLGVVAGAVVWSSPVVQTINTAVAGAQDKTGTCHDISHLDLIVMRDGQGPYGIQWDPGEGWSKHSTSSKHCLAGYTWTQPPSSVLSGLPTPSGNVLSYQLTLPAGMSVVVQSGQPLAWSKAGTQCQRAVSLGSNKWRFDRWCSGTTTTTTRPTTTTTTRPTTTTTTTRPTTTTSRPTTTTTAPTTTTTVRGGGGGNGSPAPGKDISHMDLIVSKPGTDRYGIQYEFQAGWGKHPSGGTSKEHCLAGLSWRVPPSSFSFSGYGSAVSLGGGAYRLTLPANVTVHEAFSKCGQICRKAVHLGGNTWRFDPC